MSHIRSRDLAVRALRKGFKIREQRCVIKLPLMVNIMLPVNERLNFCANVFNSLR
jgi:hypothetical protein